jgi:hypothetical protein
MSARFRDPALIKAGRLDADADHLAVISPIAHPHQHRVRFRERPRVQLQGL